MTETLPTAPSALPFDGDRLLAVKRHPSDYRRRIAKVKLSDFHDPVWLSRGGGRKSAFMAHPFVFGRVRCDAFVEGRVAHSCKHGPPPHRILVCMVQTATPKDIVRLVMLMASQRQTVRAHMKQRGATHWLQVAADVVATHPVPNKRPRNTLRRKGRRRPTKGGAGSRTPAPTGSRQVSQSRMNRTARRAAMRAALAAQGLIARGLKTRRDDDT